MSSKKAKSSEFSGHEYNKLKGLLGKIDQLNKYVYLDRRLRFMEELQDDDKKIRTGIEFASQLKECLNQLTDRQAENLSRCLTCESKKIYLSILAAIDHHSHFTSLITASVVGFFSEPHAKKTTTRILINTLMKKSQDIYLEWQRVSRMRLEAAMNTSTFVMTAFRKKQ